jgi:hypothetical protein
MKLLPLGELFRAVADRDKFRRACHANLEGLESRLNFD